MATETGEEVEELAGDDGSTDVCNGVAVHFTDGDVQRYAFVVRTHEADWLYAEVLSGGDDGFDEEEVEALNADEVQRITSERVHLFDDGAVHYGDDLVVDPTALVEDSWFDADVAIL